MIRTKAKGEESEGERGRAGRMEGIRLVREVIKEGRREEGRGKRQKDDKGGWTGGEKGMKEGREVRE